MTTQRAPLVEDPDGAEGEEDAFQQARLESEQGEQPHDEDAEDAAATAADAAKANLAVAKANEKAAARAAQRLKRPTITPTPPESPVESMQRRRQEEWELELAHLSDSEIWYVELLGPLKDSKGRRVSLGIIPEAHSGPCTYDALGEIVGGGLVRVCLQGDPRDPQSRWSRPIKLRGDPRPEVRGYAAADLGEPGGPVAPRFDDEWVDIYDPTMGAIRIRKSDAEARARNQVNPQVAAQIEAIKVANAATQDVLKSLMAMFQAPKGEDTLAKMMQLDRERMQADAERLRAEAKEERERRDAERAEAAEIRRAEAEALREARKEEREDARRAQEAADARHRESLAAIEARLAEEREANRASQQQFQELLARKDERPDPMEAIGSTIEMMKSISEMTGGAVGGGGGESEGSWWQGPAGTVLQKLPDVLDRIFTARGQMAPPAKQIAPPKKQPAQAAVPFEGEEQQPEAEQEPEPTNGNGAQEEPTAVPMNEAIAMFLNGVTEHMDANRPASHLAEEVSQSMPDFAKEIGKYATADVMMTELTKIPTYPGFGNCADPVKAVQERVAAGKKPWVESFLASLKKKVK